MNRGPLLFALAALAALCGGLLAISALFIEALQVHFPWLTEAKLAFSNFVLCACLFVGFSLLFPDHKVKNAKEGSIG